MSADEIGGGRLITDDTDNILSIEIAGHAKKGLFAIVVIIFSVFEKPVVAANGPTGQFGDDGPTGKGPGTLPNIDLRVVAHAHAEQL